MVITIDTGYQNRPSWLWQTTSFITGSHAHSVLWQARDPGGGDDFFFFFFFACQLSIPNQTGYIRGVQYCNRVCIWMFLVRYIVTGCIFRAPSAIWQGQVLTPPAAPPIQLRSRVPPPPPPPGRSLRTEIVRSPCRDRPSHGARAGIVQHHLRHFYRLRSYDFSKFVKLLAKLNRRGRGARESVRKSHSRLLPSQGGLAEAARKGGTGRIRAPYTPIASQMWTRH